MILGRDKYNRRKFLSRLGAGAAVLPFLDAERAEAGCLGAAGPKRVVLVPWVEGVLPGGDRSHWPSGSGSSFSLPTIMRGADNLEPYKNDLIFLDALNYQFMPDSGGAAEVGPPLKNGHGATQGILTGVPIPKLYDPQWNNVGGGPSIDQYIGTSLRNERAFPGEPNLCLGAWVTESTYCSWVSKGVPIRPKDDPWAVWTQYFTSARAPDVVSGSPGPGVRNSVLDYLKDDLKRFATALGTEDRARIDRHLDGVREIEKQLTAPVKTASCGATLAGAVLDADARSLAENFPRLLRLQMDLLVSLLAADVTRVITLEVTSGSSYKYDLTFPWLTSHYDLVRDDNFPNEPARPIGAYHKTVHSADWEGMFKITQWFYQQFAYLLKGLADTPEGGKRMLDNSTVLFINQMEEGDSHRTSNVPCMLAGSCGGFFKTGQNIQLPKPSPVNNGLLVALANAMDVPTAQFGAYPGDLTSLLKR